MWGSVATTVLTEVIRSVGRHVQENAQRRPSPPRQFAPAPEWTPYNPHKQDNFQGPQERQHVSRRSNKQEASTCSNCCNHTNHHNPGRNQTVKPKKSGNTNVIHVPDNGNFEVIVKQTQGDFTKIKIRTGKQPTDKGDSNKSDGAKKPSNNSNGVNKKPFNAAKNNQNQGGNNKKPFNVAKNNQNQEGKKPQPQSTWMYLGRIKIGTTEKDLLNFLTVRFPRNKFRIEKLPLFRDGKLPCFKVLVENAILEDFQDKNLWPEGVKITKFHSNFKN